MRKTMPINHDLTTKTAFVWTATMDPVTRQITKSDEPIAMMSGTIKEIEDKARSKFKFSPVQFPYLTSAYDKRVRSIEKLMSKSGGKMSFIEAYRISIG
jgi:hypothetical protein